MFKENKISNSALFIFVLGMILYGCIEEFSPQLKSSSEIIVIDGSLIKGQEQQIVTVSWTTNIDNPEFNPVSGCNVKIMSETGTAYVFHENDPGEYQSDIPDDALIYNTAYQLIVKTPEGIEFESDFDTLYQSSPIDSIYWEVESYQSSSEAHYNGLQFYTDLRANSELLKYYRWSVEETYELHTSYEIDAYYVREFDSIVNRPISDSINVCWSTNPVREIYTSSIENLTSNEKKKIELNYVSGIDPRLNVKYSILVKQFPLTKNAFTYWNNHKIASVESGGLYQIQPAQSVTNFRCLNNDSQRVLGYFWASSFTEKRIFFSGPLINFFSDCDLWVCEPPDCKLYSILKGMGRDTVYLVGAEYFPSRPDLILYYGILFNQLCIDCTAEGATIVKPDFWE